jgi:hypothetical protein
MKTDREDMLMAQWEADVADRDETIKLLRELSASVEQNAVRKEREAVLLHLKNYEATLADDTTASGLADLREQIANAEHIVLKAVP